MRHQKPRYSKYNSKYRFIVRIILCLFLVAGVFFIWRSELLIYHNDVSQTNHTSTSGINAVTPSNLPTGTPYIPSPSNVPPPSHIVTPKEDAVMKEENDSEIQQVTPTPLPSPTLLTKEDFDSLPSTSVIDSKQFSDYYRDYEKEFFFYSTELSEEIQTMITGISFKENDTIFYEDLRYVRVLHYGFDEEIHIGELIVNKEIAKSIVDIFYELFQKEYPIEKMVLIDNYNGDDEASMQDNNTSAFNYRPINGSSSLSKHSMGLAIDINPLYNPYIKEKSGKITILPKEGKLYTDRTLNNNYYIKKDDICYQAFTSRGFTWGGNWNSLKDYQHFEFSPPK